MYWKHRNRTRDLLSLGGWLFADLLLALAMLFFTSSIIATPARSVKPTPTPKARPPLELNKHRVTLTIDAAGILNGVPGAAQSLDREIRGLSFLHDRSAGLVIVYGGAPTAEPYQ